MDADKLTLVVGQLIVPVILLWELHKSNQWCRRYEQMLERQHRRFLETIAELHNIPLIASETTDELFARMQRIQEWRTHGLDGDQKGPGHR